MLNDGSRIPDEALVATVRDRARARIKQIDADLAAGRIDELEWYQAVSAVLSTAYLAFDDPFGQSGYHGTPEQWRQAREVVVAGIDRSGSFLDVGCASGLLMESVVAWSAEKGWEIEPYGLDISAELASRAQSRLPSA